MFEIDVNCFCLSYYHTPETFRSSETFLSMYCEMFAQLIVCLLRLTEPAFEDIYLHR